MSFTDSSRLGRMYDAIEFGGSSAQTVDQLALYAGVPVYNGPSDEWHPTQALADFLTLREHVARPQGELTISDGRTSHRDGSPRHGREACHARGQAGNVGSWRGVTAAPR